MAAGIYFGVQHVCPYKATDSSNHNGGGTTVFVNNRCCKPVHVAVNEHLCTPKSELLALGLCYLPTLHHKIPFHCNVLLDFNHTALSVTL